MGYTLAIFKVTPTEGELYSEYHEDISIEQVRDVWKRHCFGATALVDTPTIISGQQSVMTFVNYAQGTIIHWAMPVDQLLEVMTGSSTKRLNTNEVIINTTTANRRDNT